MDWRGWCWMTFSFWETLMDVALRIVNGLALVVGCVFGREKTYTRYTNTLLAITGLFLLVGRREWMDWRGWFWMTFPFLETLMDVVLNPIPYNRISLW